jgi:riboflavin synthase
MFTGIIKDVGEVADIKETNKGRVLRIRTALPLAQAAIGASIACDGCCLTVVEKTDDSFTVDVSAETLSKTSIGGWTKGAKVNLESSLRLGDEMGGHLVSGHVDGLAVLESVKPDGESFRLRIKVPKPLASYIAPKGSVALNGISLTVNEVEGDVFGVCIIPHTWKVTNIADVNPGGKMNLEVDMLARYVARILGKEAA